MACLRLKIIEDVDNDNDEDDEEEEFFGFATKETKSSGFYEICGLLLKPPTHYERRLLPFMQSFEFWDVNFFLKNLFIIVLLSRVQGFNNFQNIFHVKKLLQSYISPYNSIKQNKNFISIHFHKMLYTARKIFLFCFQKYKSFLSDHIDLGATAHGNWGRKGRKGKELILNEEEVEG